MASVFIDQEDQQLDAKKAKILRLKGLQFSTGISSIFVTKSSTLFLHSRKN